MSEFQLDREGCLQRQTRLVQAMAQLDVDRVVLTRSESIQWLTGAYVGPLFEPIATVDAEGQVTLVLPARKIDTPSVCNSLVSFEAKWHSTMRNDQRRASSAALLESLSSEPQKPAGEFGCFSMHVADAWKTKWIDIEPTMLRLRRQKHADELGHMRRANEANRKMYEHARAIIKPGVNELDVYNQLASVAVKEVGEPLTYLGQDFRCAARGGAPRNREARAGELYILDLGIGYRGYYTDNARTISVDGNPTPLQLNAWKRLSEVFPLVESTVRPGVSCRGLHEQVQQMLDPAQPWMFNHHLGHGVGLSPHEGPHLNPRWDDTFAEGDFFTVEPGLYHEDLNAGIRLEQNYVVTAEGVELLTDWPLELC